MNLPDLFPYIAIIISIAVPFISFYAGVSAGVRKERIKLCGNTLPRFENPPPPPPRESGWTPIEATKPEYYEEVLAQLGNGGLCIVWRANDGQKDYYTVTYSNSIVEPVYWRPLPKPMEKKRGVPNMPNHPPMPERLDLIGAMGLNIKDPYAIEKTRVNCPPSVTHDQLIDALMDMRLENFLCAHTIPAHAGTDLYYFSRKETAEYLLDMYHITPKAKH